MYVANFQWSSPIYDVLNSVLIETGQTISLEIAQAGWTCRIESLAGILSQVWSNPTQTGLTILITTAIVLLAVMFFSQISQRYRPKSTATTTSTPASNLAGTSNPVANTSYTSDNNIHLQHLEALFCNQGEATLLADSNGIVASAHGGLIEELGIDAANLIGQPQFGLLNHGARRLLLQNTLPRERPIKKYDFEMPFRFNSGEPLRWLSVFGGQVKDNQEKTWYLTFIRDIDELVQARVNSRDRTKLETMYRVCEGLAKDYNNWIREINLYANMIDDDSLRQCIREANDRASELTNNLLKFSSDDTEVEHVVVLTEFVKSLTPLINRMLPAQIRFQVESRVDKTERVRIDPADLQQIFINVIENSIQAISDTGNVKVTISTKEFSARQARARTVVAGNYAIISFTDDGLGMSRQVIKRAFEPFFTTRRKTGIAGMGMGLPMAHHLVSKAGGAMDIQSSPNGTEVCVLLPLSVEEPKPNFVPPLEGTFQEKTVVSGERILLVEDQELLRNAIHNAMSGAGFKVQSFATAEEAWEAMLSDFVADCVVSDIVLTGMSGVQLYEKIREHDARQKIILISGYRPGRFVDETRFENDQFVRFVQKPFLINKLIATLDDLKESSSQVQS